LSHFSPTPSFLRRKALKPKSKDALSFSKKTLNQPGVFTFSCPSSPLVIKVWRLITFVYFPFYLRVSSSFSFIFVLVLDFSLKLYETVHQKILENAAEQDENVPDKQQLAGKGKKGKAARQTKQAKTDDQVSTQILERGLETVAICIESLFAITKEKKEKELVKTISEKFHEFPLDDISSVLKTSSVQASIMALAGHLSAKDVSHICDNTLTRLKSVKISSKQQCLPTQLKPHVSSFFFGQLDSSLLDGTFDVASSLRSIWNWGQFDKVNTLIVEWLEGSILGTTSSKSAKQAKKGKQQQPQAGKVSLDDLTNLASPQKPTLALRYLDVILVRKNKNILSLGANI
jgi:hypothetical protein